MGEYMPIESQNIVVSAAISVESGPSEGLLEEDENARMEQLSKEVVELRKKETSYTHRLNEAKSFWETKVQALSEEVEQIRNEAQAREVELKELQQPKHEALKRMPGPKCLGFVLGPTFSSITSLVIMANIVTIFMQHFYNDLLKPYDEEIFWANHFFLAFYVLELTLKFTVLHCKVLFGPPCVVWWNWVDLVIVLVGIAEQWVVPLAIAYGYLDMDNAEALTMLRHVRLFRLVRVLKVFHGCMASDFGWTEGHRFQLFMMGVIAFNSLSIAAQEDMPWLPFWVWLNGVLLVIYCFELWARLAHWGCRFFCHRGDWVWNWLDFLIVLGGVASQWGQHLIGIYRHCMGLPPLSLEDIQGSKKGNLAKVMMMLRLARLLRILRLVRLVRSIQPLYTLVLGIVQAMQGMVWVVVLTVLFLYIWAIFGVVLIGHGLVFGEAAPVAVAKIFPNVPESMYVLFKVMNGDMGDLEPLFEVMPVSKVFCVTFMVISSWAILSILTAVVSENMISATEGHRAEIEKDTEDDKLARSKAKLEEIFLSCDADESGTLSREEFDGILADTNRVDELSEACGLEKEDFVHIFDLLSTAQIQEDGSIISSIKRTDFVEALQRDGSTVTERAVWRLEKRLSHIETGLMVLEQKSHKDNDKVASFMESIEHRLESVQEAADIAPQLASLEKRLGAGEAAASTAATASAEQAMEMKRMLSRLEQRLADSAAAAQQAQAVAEQATRAAVEASQEVGQQVAQQVAQQVVQQVAQLMAGTLRRAAGDEAAAESLGKQSPRGEVQAFSPRGDGMEAAATGSIGAWEVKTLLLGQEDPPLPVPQPRFAAAPGPAGTGEEPIGSMRGVMPGAGEPSDRNDVPEDPLDYLLH